MSKKLLNQVKKRLLTLSPLVNEGIERECNKDDFEALDDKALGKGGFGQVWKVRNKNNGNIYAIKVINKNYIQKENMTEQINREIDIMYSTDHPNIIKLFNHYEDDDNFYLIMELAKNGQLYSLLKKYKKLDEKTVGMYVKDVISAVMYLHSINIIHRDIKPENILLNEDNLAKLADFGWSNFLESDKTRDTLAGTPEYLAPEMIMKTGHDHRVDVWSIGVLLFELLAGRAPFIFSGDIGNLYSNIKNLKIKWTDDFPILAKDLVGKLLKFKPTDRITLEQALEHPWFKEVTKNLDNKNVSKKNEVSRLKLSLMTIKKDDFNSFNSTMNIILKSKKLSNYLNNYEKDLIKSKEKMINEENSNEININEDKELRVKEIIEKRRESILENLKSNDDNNITKQELKLKNDEINFYKQETIKLNDIIVKLNSRIAVYEQELNFEKNDDNSLLKLKELKELEKSNYIKELEEKSNKILVLQKEYLLLKDEHHQIKNDYNLLKSKLDFLNEQKLEDEKIINELKAKINCIEEQKQNDLIEYEKKERLNEYKILENVANISEEGSDNKNPKLSLQKSIDISNFYVKNLIDCINNKVIKIEERIKNQDINEVEKRKKLLESIDSNISILSKTLKDNYHQALEKEKELFNIQLDDLKSKNDSYLKNIEWYKDQINTLYPYKVKVSQLEIIVEEHNNLYKEITENLDIYKYKLNTLDKIKTRLDNENTEIKNMKDLYKNAFKDAERLFEQNSKGKKLRDLINFKILDI